MMKISYEPVDISLIPPRKRDYSKAKQEPKHDPATARPAAAVERT
jgi:hypothetical protein